MKKHNTLVNMIWAAMFLALAYILPFLTGQIPRVGAMLCPMHIPVLLCGFICGGPWGLVVGFFAPLLRSVILGMPQMMPTAVCMAFELATYGAIAGYLYKVFPKKKGFIYCALLIAMVAGRAVWGIAMSICMGMNGSPFGLSAFFAGAVTNAILGIVLQIILVPILIMVLEKVKKNAAH